MVRWGSSGAANRFRIGDIHRVWAMGIWIGLAILAVLAGLSLTGFALVRVGSGLRSAERQRQMREGSESLFLETKLRDLAASQSEIAGRFSQAIESQARS